MGNTDAAGEVRSCSSSLAFDGFSLVALLTDLISCFYFSDSGPAEVAVWGILETIWSGFHELIDGFADAGEVRCAFLLGSGHPERAKLSACKSFIFCSAFAALFDRVCSTVCVDCLS